jgi:hypothetical protein
LIVDGSGLFEERMQRRVDQVVQIVSLAVRVEEGGRDFVTRRSIGSTGDLSGVVDCNAYARAEIDSLAVTVQKSIAKGGWLGIEKNAGREIGTARHLPGVINGVTHTDT